MTNIAKVCAGVDVSRKYLDIYVYPNGKYFRIPNSVPGIKKFVTVIAQYDIELVACEATGGYEKLLGAVLNENNQSLWIIDPRRIKGFIVAAGCKIKSDKRDAQMIAEFVAKNPRDYAPAVKSKGQNELLYLINRRNDLSKMAASEKGRITHPAHMNKATTNSITRVVKFVAAEIKLFDDAIDAILADDAELAKKAAILESIPGIGRLTAVTLLSFVPELGTMANAKISALIGVAPYVNSSGDFEGKMFTKGGRAIPRNILYMAALSTIKYQPLKPFYERLIAEKKPFKVAIVAVMRKLAALANTLLQ